MSLRSLWSGFYSLLSKKPVEFTAEEYENVLFSAKVEEEKEPEQPEEKFDTYCQHRIGVITKMFPDYCMIDHKYYVDISELTGDIKQGDKVEFEAYVVDVNRDLKVSNVKLLERDQWVRGTENTDNESCLLKENATILKNEPGQITERNGRNLKIDPPGITCNMDKVKMEFIPIVGDHVLLTAIAEVIENRKKHEERIIDVREIRYRGCKTLDGRITHLEVDGEDIRGIINREVYFTKNECEPGYTPALNDEVAATVIESTQGELLWRAIKIIPPPELDQGPDYAQIFAQEKLFENKMGLEVHTVSPKVNIKIGDNCIYQVIIKNRNEHNAALKKIVLRNFQGREVIRIRADFTDPITIPARNKITIDLEVKPDSPGCVRETLILHFEGDFEIGTGIEFIGIDDRCKDEINASYDLPQRSNVRAKNMEKRNAAVKKITLPTKVGFVVPGIRPIKPASFIPNRLDQYPIPKNLANILLNEEDTFKKFSEIESAVVKLYPCMIEELDEKNYLLKFHNLLHIEDQELSIAIKKYDRERVCFDRRGEYLSLEIPNLAESRPSLVIGDKLIASDPAIFGKSTTKYEGYIHKVNANSIFLRFNDSFHNSYNGKDYSVTFVHSRTGIRRCHQAINLVHAHLGRDWLFPDTLSNLKNPQVSIVSEDPPIEEQIEEKHTCPDGEQTVKPQSNLQVDVGPVEDYVHKERVLKWINVTLNHFQKEAVRNILGGEARPFPYVIFGPPGTGKTVTVVETILQIKIQMPYSRILVATPSNSSADLICDRLLSWNLLIPGDLVRIVGFNYINEDRIPPRVKPFCTVVDLKGANNAGDGTYEEDGIRHSNKQAIGRHTITVGTCVSLGILYTMGFPKGHFTHVIIDEAGQATEPEISIPLAFLNTDNQAILAGDPRQLGPVITSRVAESLGLGESLLSRFLMRFPYHRDPESYPDTNGYDPRLVTWLLYNYRSLPQILNLYSELFYDAKLQPMVCDKCSEEAQVLKMLANEVSNLKTKTRGTATSIVFHGVRGVNAQEEDSPSWFNDHEVIKVVDYLQDFYKCGLTNEDIGIITPYQKQVMKIREMLRRFDLDLPKVGSVEEFQGQERKIIILSTVRSDEGLLDKDKKHALGFVACKQRLNVAISRARCALVIIGNPHLLVKDISWRSLIKTCLDSDCYTGCDLPLIISQR
ncbi:probable RNA helicase armi [Planococcus citri]|uniref:probable RNA helicase armi n=1 Tax=Planococcus citri TaxID=170843 RepID=UPI0031F86C0A